MRQRGFSLVELAVTLVVFGILLLSVLPAAAAWLRGARIRNLAESLQSGLQQARDEAVRRNMRVGFWLVASPDPKVMDDRCTVSSSGAGWVVSVSSPAGLCATAPSTRVEPRLVRSAVAGEAARVAEVAAVDAAGEPVASVMFDGFGRVAGTGIGRITIASADGAAEVPPLRLEISAAGRIRMCDPAVRADGDPRRCEN